jgi:hypothetical protein
MVQSITNVIKEYQAKVSQLPFVPKASLNRDSMGYCGDVNKFFLTFLFCDHATGMNFLRDVGITTVTLIRDLFILIHDCLTLIRDLLGHCAHCSGLHPRLSRPSLPDSQIPNCSVKSTCEKCISSDSLGRPVLILQRAMRAPHTSYAQN